MIMDVKVMPGIDCKANLYMLNARPGSVNRWCEHFQELLNVASQVP